MYRLTLILDDSGHPLGATAVADFEGDHEVIWPLDVGPFDTAAEVLQALLARCPFQLSLW